jgi:hypothetical protein
MSIFKIHYVPTDDPVLSGFLAGKLAALRLQALTVSAEAFGGQLVTEIFAHMPYTQWIERLRRPHVHTLVAIAYPDGTSEEDQTVDKGDMVGTAVISKFSRDTQEFQWRNIVTDLKLELGPFLKPGMKWLV